MKAIVTFILLLTSLKGIGQPQGINYQGVARDSIGHALINQAISLRISILDSSSGGSEIYIESHSTNTNNSGLFNLSIGLGSPLIGSFDSIRWDQGNKWLMVKMDQNGGTNYQFVGTSQFMSVPYALTAGKISNHGSSIGSIQYWDGNNWVNLQGGQSGQQLFYCNGIPHWGGCPPELNTTLLCNNLGTSLKIAGEVTFAGGECTIDHGICWATHSNSTILDNHNSTPNLWTQLNSDCSGNYETQATNLLPGTLYYIRSYATNSGGTAYGNEIQVITTAFSVGQSYMGGKIAYIDCTGNHGLIISNVTLNYSYWTSALTVTGATDWNNGLSNTLAIINSSNGSGNSAANVCRNYNGGGYSDWYLPAIGQLEMLNVNRAQLNISSEYIWSSTEISFHDAYIFDFVHSNWQGLPKDVNQSGGVQMRAMREF